MSTKKKEFIIFKNGARFKPLKSESFEKAVGDAREKFKHLKGDYLEIKTPEGRFVPLFQ